MAGRSSTPLLHIVARPVVCGAVALLLTGCQMLPSVRDTDSFLGLITPYRMDIVQGNVVTREQADQVKPGMSRAQVRDILGSPMLTDLFHADRWDYAFTIRRQGTEPQRRSVVAHFNGDRLERLVAPDLPTEREFVASISRSRKTGAVPALELSAEQRQALPAPPKVAPVPAAPPTGAQRDYPPLEPS